MNSPASSAQPRARWRILHSEASRGWGGQEHRVMAELSGFQQRGCPVWLVAHPKSQILKRATAAGMGVRACAFDRRLLPIDSVRLALWLRRERIQVVNTHSSRDGWLLGIAARLARTPLLIRSRHIDVSYPNPSVSKHAFTTFADHVLTTSQKITDHFRQIFPLTDDHITTLPTGIDVARFHPDGPRAELPVRQEAGAPPVIGMVSVLRSWKGHPTFFEAVRLLREAGRDFQFVVVGGGAPTENYIGMARRAGVEGQVAFTGHREDVPDILRALDVLCIPSLKHEGVPQIGLQALACGTAVVGSDCGGIPEIIQEGRTGRIFPAGDAQALASRIAEAVDQAEETRHMRQDGRVMVEQEHSLEHMLDRLDGLYRRYLGAPHD
ncbi:glycosyltransferase family 4 protein [Prosthecobacter sp.]|uniref:glycosyltransferase family 4 protein n=1 Tax=Prosthecobacter sp. TaxID=1965333 RepID=UPI001D3481B0|nr:glycosyltransferase family 4 protein [Prosthecobacter sp.]MCB1275279.1 glycosyltransferase family 4 protein [Prosthecobacter sp.]